jgi:hypothetical protein
LLLSSFVICYAFARRNKTLLRQGSILILIPIVFWFLMCFKNNNYGYGFTFSKSGHAFVMARLSQMGILKEYLDENCPKKNYKVCACKDQLPTYTWNYMWGSESPLEKAGGWDSAKAEDEIILKEILTSPRFLAKFLQKSLTGAVKQIATVGIANKTYQGDVLNSSPYVHISAYIPNEKGEYLISLQNTTSLDGSTSNLIFYLFFLISTLWVLFHLEILSEQTKFAYFLIFVFFIVNAGITSTLSCVHCRFMNRVFWILPTTNAILMIGYYWNKLKRKQIEESCTHA